MAKLERLKRWWTRRRCRHYEMHIDTQLKIVWCRHCGMSRWYSAANYETYTYRMRYTRREYLLD